MRNEVLLFSGGLDSLIAWYYLKKPLALYLPLGHQYQSAEWRACMKIATMTEMDLLRDGRLYMGDMETPTAFIPMRNSLLAHIGVLYGHKVWITVQKGEMDIPDRSPEFFKELSTMLRFLNENPKIEVNSPFWHMTKTEMVRWYVEAGHPIDVLLASSSCYKGEMVPCGECPACFRRWVALENNGIEEQYQVNPWETKLAQDYLEKMKAGKYDPQRAKETLDALHRKESV